MILFLLVILSAGYAFGKGPFDDWKYRGEAQAPAARFVALPLSPQNLDLCDKSDLSDLRITDMRGLEVPHAVVYETESRSEKERTGIVLNREFSDPSTSRLTVDFGAGLTKNSISVETSGNNFRRRLKVDGSDDLLAWATLLPEGWLLAAGDTPERRFESVNIGANTYRYIRVSVEKMPEENEAPRILRVVCRHVVVRSSAEFAVQGKLTDYTTAAGISTAVIDMGTRNLAVQRLRLLLARNPERIFEKHCVVSGRNSSQHPERVRFETQEYGRERTVETPWEPVGSGTVYQNQQGNRSLDLPMQARFRYTRVRIDDGDSPPLELSGATGYAVATYLVFEPADQSRFILYAGKADAQAPRYESARMLAALDTRNLPKCTAVEFERQPGSQPKELPPGQRFVWFVLAAVVAFTVWILWHTARAIRREETSAPPGDEQHS